MSAYPGIDYSGLGSKTNRDPETWIRYGVVSQNSIHPEAMEDIWRGSRDLSYEAAVEEAKKRLASAFSNDDPSDRESDFWSVAKDLCGMRGLDEAVRGLMEVEKEGDLWDVIADDFNDAYQSYGDHDWLWEEDGYRLANCLVSDIIVLKSPFYTYAQFCSPCVPGAGNLDHPFVCEFGDVGYARAAEEQGWPKVFCLGHDFFEGNRAPYPVFRVDDATLAES